MELDTYLRFVAALVFVLALIGALTWAVKRYGLFGRVAPTPRGGRRLAVVESATIDVRRRLVLVRRDDAEHLLLLGPTGDLVVERGISPASGGPSGGPTAAAP